MSESPPFDLSRAHRYLSADCFNRAWEYIAKPERTSDEDERMILLSQASLWHWTQREDCAPANLSIGYWQLSRVCALAGRLEEARRHGELCLQHSRDQQPFLLAYAHEALARAAMLRGDREAMTRHLDEARRLAGLVEDAEERAAVGRDLDAIR